MPVTFIKPSSSTTRKCFAGLMLFSVSTPGVGLVSVVRTNRKAGGAEGRSSEMLSILALPTPQSPTLL